MMAGRFAVGLLLSLAIAGAGFLKGALTREGMLAAVVEGTVIFGGGGWAWGAVLIAFFVLSSALSFYRRREKRSLAEKFAKGSRRDVGQVLANGGLGLLLALAFLLSGEAQVRRLLFAAYVGAMATVNADTWATEIGVLGRGEPRLITTGQVVERGTSGGVTLVGTASALLGGAAMGLVAALFEGAFRRWLLIGAVGGLAGALFDSLLGATVQAIYYSERRRKETERSHEADGTPNRLLRGWVWMDNDKVNFISSMVGALVAALLQALLT